MAFNDFWRYGDTSFRQKIQVTAYVNILKKINEHQVLTKQQIFDVIVELNLKRKDSKNPMKDVGLVLKTMTWFNWIKIDNDQVSITESGKFIVDDNEVENFQIILDFFELTFPALKILNLMLNEFISKNPRRKDYGNFNLIPLRAIFKKNDIHFDKYNFRKVMQWIDFDGNSNFKLKDSTWRKPPSSKELYDAFMNSLNIQEMMDNFYKCLFYSKNKIKKMFRNFYLANISDKTPTPREFKLNKDFILEKMLAIEGEIKEKILAERMEETLLEFSDLNVRWFNDLNLFLKIGKKYIFNKKYEIIYNLSKHLEIDFFSDKKIDLFEHKELLTNLIIEYKNNHSIEQTEKEIPNLESVDLFLNSFEDIESYSKWVESNKDYKGVERHVLFEYYSSLKVWWIIDGKQKNTFFKGIRTLLDNNGIPIAHAPGGQADAIFNDGEMIYLIEPSIHKTVDSLIEKEKHQAVKHLKRIEDVHFSKKCSLNIILSFDNSSWRKLIENYSDAYKNRIEDPNASFALVVPLRNNRLINISNKKQLNELIETTKKCYSNSINPIDIQNDI